MRDAAAAADIVIRTCIPLNVDGIAQSLGRGANFVPDTADSSDNVPGASAISKGMKEGHSPEKPGYWIHVSGTSILTWYDAAHGRSGEGPVPEQVYHDIKDVQSLVTLPEQADHRNVDIMVQGSISDAVRVAIVCPPTIYGRGAGAINQRSIQVPDMVRSTLRSGYAPIVGKGKTEWDNVHINDLGDVFVRLVDATQDPSKNSNPEIFGLNGYFFTNYSVHLWSDVAKMVAEEAHKQKLIAKPETRVISQEEANNIEGFATPSYGLNSKSVGERAKKYLGWEAKDVPMKDTLAELVADEAKALGIKR